MINEYLELYVYFRSGETYVDALYTTLEIDPSSCIYCLYILYILLMRP